MKCAVCGKDAVGITASGYKYQLGLCRVHMKKHIKEGDDLPEWAENKL